jgi:hypothetical protein
VSFLLLRGADFSLVNLEEHAVEKARLEHALEGRKLDTPVLRAGEEWLIAPSLSDLGKKLESWRLPAETAPFRKLPDPTAG